MKLTLIKKTIETPDVTSFLFEPNQKFNWTPGQYLHYTLDHQSPDDRGIERYFTISSAPSEGHVMISTRLSPKGSSFKNSLQSLKVGESIEADGPDGDFTYDGNFEVVFIAGGIGITPFRSILVDMDFKNLNPKITLLYSNRTKEIPFKDLFDTFSFKHDNLKVVYTVTEDSTWDGEKSTIDEEFIKKYVPDFNNPIFYISGPEPMVESMGDMIKNMGITENKIKQDFFPGYETP